MFACPQGLYTTFIALGYVLTMLFIVRPLLVRANRWVDAWKNRRILQVGASLHSRACFLLRASVCLYHISDLTLILDTHIIVRDAWRLFTRDSYYRVCICVLLVSPHALFLSSESGVRQSPTCFYSPCPSHVWCN